ncbi:MAG TPA: SpoIIE family protein phosphatase [Acidimicrobiales bacterium]|nr:SpoIIE family protein phosphatase [Acidimicrobiales bacterium]
MLSRALSFFVGSTLLGVIAGVRFVTEADVVPVATVVIAPLLVAAVSKPFPTAAVGLAALVVAAGMEIDDGWGPSSLPRLAVIGAAAVLGVIVASERERRDTELVRRREDSAVVRRLELALDAGAMGTWSYDAASGRTVWDERLEALHGLRPGEYDGTFQSWIERVMPEDRPALLAASDRALETGGHYEAVYRIVCPDGAMRWLQARGEPFREGGRARGTAGVVVDVTRQAVAAAELDKARQEARRSLAERNQLGLSLQENLLPAPRLECGRVDVLTHYQAGERFLLLGGDFFDVVQRGDSVRFVIGDVSGHSAYAAALGTALRAGWRAMALRGADEPGRWVDDLQALLESETDDPECFATICTGALTAGELCVAVAGHPPPMLLDDEGLRPLPVTASPPLGLSLGPAVQLTVPLRGPYAVFLYTDGVVEGRSAPGSADRFGVERLALWLDEHTPQRRFFEAQDLAALVAELREANGGPLSDDVTILVVQDGESLPRTPPRRSVRERPHAHLEGAHESRTRAREVPPQEA